MINVTLRGVLAKKFGESYRISVNSILEIFEALEANNPSLPTFFRKTEKIIGHFLFIVNGKIIPSYRLNNKMLKPNDSVEIVPILQGGGITLLVVGLILIAIGLLLFYLLKPDQPKDVQTSSSLLSSTRNVENRNIPIPIGYGRLRVGSAVISNSVDIYYKGTNNRPDKPPSFKDDPDKYI